MERAEVDGITLEFLCKASSTVKGKEQDMPVDPRRITEVAQRLSTRLEVTYRDVPDAEVEGVLVVAAVKRGGSRDHVVHFNTSDMPAYAARGLLAEVDDHLGGNLPGGRD